ncbi:hypothetical protein ES319_A03G112500v1 [Gossypium barbadense]|uniref:Uncharacterized protein n=1 Tax=Gossypium barbadense TaxID=3634 RepID=A0A5J5WC60_GOSBA|nr:hypothetical protein ES319_A03G112500v1 [Gossypium barbadense]
MISISSQQKRSLKFRLRRERKGLTIQHTDVKSVLNRVKKFADKPTLGQIVRQKLSEELTSR